MKSNKLLLVIAVILLFTNYLTYSSIDNLENRISNLNNSLSRLDNRISNISGDVSRSLDEFKAENSWTRNTQARAMHYNEETMTASVDIEVEFNELRNDEKVYIVIQDSEGNTQDKIDVTEAMKNSLNLDYSLNLGIDNDYELSIIGETAELKRSESLGELYLKSRIQQLFYVDGNGWDVEYDDNNNYKSIRIDIMIDSAYQKEEFIADYFKNRKIKDIQGEIYVDDVLFDTVDFLNDENWEFDDLTSQDNDNKEEVAVRETPAMQEGMVPLFEINATSKYFINLNGTYTFEKPVNPQQKVKMIVVFKDNKGDDYRYLLYTIFNYEGR
jgi:hypothetical protein